MSMSVYSEIKEKIVIVGRNYGNILAMARAVGRAGYDADVLRLYKKKPKKINVLSRMKPEALSKYVGNYSECVVGEDMTRAIAVLMAMDMGSNKALLIPVDDYACGIVDDNILCLKNKYIVPEIDGKQGGIKQLMDKNIQKKLAEDAGLPVLKSVLIKSEKNICIIPEDIPYPCFVKPNVSMNDTKASMARCDNRAQLDALIDKYASNSEFEFLAEEFADIKNEYSLLGISDGDKVYAPGLFRAEIGGHRERKGVAMTGVTEDLDRFRTFIEKCEEYVSSLNFKGLFDIDMIETTDGNIYFIEINFRAGASVHVFTELGINMPGLFADKMLKGIPIDTTLMACQSGKRFLSEKILLEEFTRNDVEVRQLKNYLKNADIVFMNDKEDPRPYKNFRKYYFVAWFMRFPYRMRDRRKGK